MATDIETAYAVAHAATLEQLAALTAIVEDLPAPDGDTRLDWGHVGSLSDLCRRLAEIRSSWER